MPIADGEIYILDFILLIVRYRFLVESHVQTADVYVSIHFYECSYEKWNLHRDLFYSQNILLQQVLQFGSFMYVLDAFSYHFPINA